MANDLSTVSGNKRLEKECPTKAKEKALKAQA
jgi:hypothetical protein